jgi:hypothetical protein
MTTLEAAQWVAKFYVGRSHTLRQLSSVAGKVMSQPGCTEAEAIAAWVYRPCEDCVPDAIAQEALFVRIGTECGAEVEQIVRSLVNPPSSSDDVVRKRFAHASVSAKRIRIAEVLVGLEAAFVVLYGGSMAKMEDVRHILSFARYSYEHSANVHGDIRKELASIMVAVENMWNAIMSTMDVMDHRVVPPDMVSCALLAVSNELGTVSVSTYQGEPTPAKLREIYDDMRREIGGNQFAETRFYCTVPLPKVDTLNPLPAPKDDPAS